MKSIIRQCKRCNEPIASKSINQKEGIYKCTNCNTVASIYDENEYKPQYNFPLLAGMRIEELSNSIILHIQKPTFVSPIISPRGCFPWLTLLAIIWFFTGCDFTINSNLNYTNKIIGVLAIAVVIAFFLRRLKRPLFIEITPLNLFIYQKSHGMTTSLYLIESYMIDQASVIVAPHPSGSPITYKLQIFTKDGKMHNLFTTFYNVKEELLCIEQFIESTLCIDDRRVSGEE